MKLSTSGFALVLVGSLLASPSLAESAPAPEVSALAAHLAVVEEQADRLQQQIAHPDGPPEAQAELDQLMEHLARLQAYTVVLDPAASPALEERRAHLLDRLRRGEAPRPAPHPSEEAPSGSGIIAGQATAVATGLPVVGISVEARQVVNGYPYYYSSTDLSGRYQLDGLADGDYYVYTDFSTYSYPYFNETYDDVICDNYNPCTVGATAVSISGGAVVSQINFALSEGGKLRGRVLDQDGVPIAGAYVRAYDAQGNSPGEVVTDLAGRYVISRLFPGAYYLRAASPQHGDELYPDIPCEGGSCNIVAGTAVSVGLDSQVTDLNFTLSRRGTIRGQVLDAETGVPIAYADVYLSDSSGGSGNSRQVSANYLGEWQVGDLGAGTYSAEAHDYDYEAELYDGIACSGTCTGPGTPILLSEGGVVEGIDFSLERLGAVNGSVREEGTLEPISGYVAVYNQQGNYLASPSINQGIFMAQRLRAGNVFIRTSTYDSEHSNELWQNLPCSGSCTVTAGTAIAVQLGQTTSGIDFELERLGRIEGHVQASSGGAPISNAQVTVYDATTGNIFDYVYSDQQGFFRLVGLPAGNFKVSARANYFRAEVWDGVPCTGTCDPSLGQNIGVTPGQTTSGIDFALEELGSLGGTVRDQLSLQPLEGFRVSVYSSDGYYFGDSYTDAGGNYRRPGLPDGDYYAVVYRSSNSAYLSEIYDGIDCLSCPVVTSGTSISVSIENGRNGIDFTLLKGGRIDGTVVRAQDGLPVTSGEISVFNSDGESVAYGGLSASGQFSAVGLETGVYYLVAGPSDIRLAAEVWPNVLCPYRSSCDPLLGTGVAVVRGEVTTANFSLDAMGSLRGRAVDAETGEALSNGTFEIYDSTGYYRGYDSIGEGGEILFEGLAADNYKIISAYNSSYIEQVFGGAFCEGTSCNLATGTPLPVQMGQQTELGDFALEFGPGLKGWVRREGSAAGGVGIDVWKPDGTHFALAATNASGRWRVALPGGIYHVSTDNGPSFIDEVWNGVFCPNGSAFLGLCDPLEGTEVAVPAAQPATDVVFFDLGSRTALFGDSFESGDFSAWSLVVGN